MSELKLVKDGKDTSEHKMSMLVIVCCIVAEIAGAITAILPQVMEGMESGTALTVMGIVLAVAGLIGKVLVSAGYNAGRIKTKNEALGVVLEQTKAVALKAAMTINHQKLHTAKTPEIPPTAAPVDDDCGGS